MLIWGQRNLRIKKYYDPFIKCECCGNHGQIFSVYQQYFYVFFIPVCPSGEKTIRSACTACKDAFNEENKKHYLSITRTPFYLYAWPILFVALIAYFTVANMKTQKQKAAFIENPEIGDVYIIRQEENASSSYYFLKVVGIGKDSLALLHSYLQYNGFVYKMNDTDYFVSDDTLLIFKPDLKYFLEEKFINSVERDYESTSRFNIERSID